MHFSTIHDIRLDENQDIEGELKGIGKQCKVYVRQGHACTTVFGGKRFCRDCNSDRTRLIFLKKD